MSFQNKYELIATLDSTLKMKKLVSNETSFFYVDEMHLTFHKNHFTYEINTLNIK